MLPPHKRLLLNGKYCQDKFMPHPHPLHRAVWRRLLTGLLIVALLCRQGYAQLHAIDSLQAHLAHHPQHDTMRVNMLADLAFRYYLFETADSVITAATAGLSIAKEIGYVKGKADCIKQLGIAYYLKGNYPVALHYDSQALALYTSLNDRSGAASVVNNIAIVHHNQAHYVQALEYYQKSLQMRQDLGDENAVGASLNNIGNTYHELGNYAEALAYLLRALKIRERHHDTIGIATTMANIANVYYSLGQYRQALLYSRKGLLLHERSGNRSGIVMTAVTIGGVYLVLHDYARTIAYFNKALRMAHETGSQADIGLCYSNLAEVYLLRQQYKESKQYYEQSLRIAEASGDIDAMAINHNGLGTVYLQTHDLTQSISHLHESFSLAQQAGAKLRIMEAARNLSKAYEQQGKYKESLQYNRLYSAYEDSVFNEETNKKTQFLQYDYELDKKQKEIAILEKDRSIQAGMSERQKLVTIALGTGIALLFLVVFLLLRSREQEKETKELIMRQKEEIQSQAKILAELNGMKDKTFSILSHDLRSPVASLTSLLALMDDHLITPDEFTALNKDLGRQLGALSLLLDNLLHWSKSEMQGRSAIRMHILDLHSLAALNLQLLSEVAHSKQISMLNTIATGTVAAGDRDLIDIVTRNLISNALKFTPVGGTITVSSYDEDDRVIVSVTDTGVGMSSSQAEQMFTGQSISSTLGTEGEKGTGLGLMLCKEFVEKNGGTLTVQSEVGKGSTFSFSLPKQVI